MGAKRYYQLMRNDIKERFGIAQIRMSQSEIICYKSYLLRSKNIIEFGAGGSTVLAARKRKNIITVESDASWITNIRQFRSIRKAEQENRLQFLTVDIG